MRNKDEGFLTIEDAPLKKKARLLQGNGNWESFGLEKYGVLPISMNDGPAGLRKPLENEESDKIPQEEISNGTYKATCFPSAALNACSWDEGLMFSFGEAMAKECQARGTGLLLSPGVNIKRNPLGGRNFEYLSEDPLLSGKMAASFIKGCQAQGVGTCLKHFACNEQETRRLTYSAEIDERTLREIYLRPFEIAIKEANPWSVMCAYNRINGVYAADNEFLLRKVLKGEWHYDGVVISDWGAVNSVIEAHKNGLDIEMPCPDPKSREITICKAVRKGIIPREAVDDSAKRIDLLSKRVHAKKAEEKISFAAHHELARQMAEKSIVLAKNDGILPLKDFEDVCIIGELAAKPRLQALGSSHVEAWQSPSFLDIVNANRKKPIPYEQGYSLASESEETRSALQFDALDLASTHKKVILFLGINEGFESEGYDKRSIRLPNSQYKLFESIYEQNKNIIVVIAAGSPIELSAINSAKAIILPYLSGQGGSEALYNIILGKTNPSGKLAETWPVHYLDCPSSIYYPGSNDFSLYKESVFVGYRYYVTCGKNTQFPFGFGLSYTKFEYSDLVISKNTLEKEKELSIRFKIKNVGKIDGEEIAELYIGQLDAHEFKPKRELKGFKRVFVRAGESVDVEFNVAYHDFSYFDIESRHYCVEDGEYVLEIGASSEDIRLKTQIHVESTFVDGGKRHDLPSYYLVKQKRPFALADEEFERLMGHPFVNDLPDKSHKLTLNSPLREIKDTYVGKMIVNGCKKFMGYEKKDPLTRDLELTSMLDLPLRVILGGRYKDRKMIALCLMADKRFFSALFALIFGARRK